MADLHDLTAREQAAAIRDGEASPTELVEHYLERIDRLSDTVGAFVTVTDVLARMQAKVAETRLADAARAGDEVGLPPLFGVPTAIKDLILTAVIRTTFGSAATADNIP